MSDGTIERLNYYQRQFLGAEDFALQQDYHRSMHRRHNLAHHTWGIVAGLELTFRQQEGRTGSEVDIFVQPGMAVDGFGREIFVFAEEKLDFGDQPPPAALRDMQVWIGYSEEPFQQSTDCAKGEESPGRQPAGPGRPCAGQTVAAFEPADGLGQYSRVREFYRLYLLLNEPPHDDIVLDGEQISTHNLDQPANAPEREELAPMGVYADEAVPHQELPDEADRPKWLVRLGSVRWDGNSFIEDLNDPQAYQELLKQGRQYVGLVASQVLAPAGKLRIRDRTTEPLRTAPQDPVDDPGVEVDLEGQLRVHRLLTAKKDIQVHGSTLDFRQTDGGNLDPNGNAYPTSIKRNSLGLEVAAGRKRQGTDPISHFKVGFDDNGAFGPILEVENTGQVAITGSLSVSGSLALNGTLDLADAQGDRLVLWGNAGDAAAAALGTEQNGDSLYHKANVRHRWYIQKNRDDGQSESMSLEASRLRLPVQLRMEKEIDFETVTGDLVMLDGPTNQVNSSGFGFDTGTLYARASQRHRWFVNALANSGAQAMELDAAGLTVNRAVTVAGNNLTLNNGSLLVNGGVIDFNEVLGDKVMLWGLAADPQSYGFGIEGGTLYARSNGRYRWYVGRVSDDGQNDLMELSNTGLTVNANLTISSGGLQISGGTTIGKLQAGTAAGTLPANAPEAAIGPINFPSVFSGGNPLVIATASEANGVAIALSATNTNNNGFSLVARRVDNNPNPIAPVNFSIFWLAWE